MIAFLRSIRVIPQGFEGSMNPEGHRSTIAKAFHFSEYLLFNKTRSPVCKLRGSTISSKNGFRATTSCCCRVFSPSNLHAVLKELYRIYFSRNGYFLSVIVSIACRARATQSCFPHLNGSLLLLSHKLCSLW